MSCIIGVFYITISKLKIVTLRREIICDNDIYLFIYNMYNILKIVESRSERNFCSIIYKIDKDIVLQN